MNPAQKGYQDQLISIAKDLDGKSTIPGVAKQLELILDIQATLWWVGVTLPILEDVRVRLRRLVRFIDPEHAKDDVFTNFEDELKDGETEYSIVKTDPNLKDYWTRVQRFIREHQDHITIRR